MEQDQKADKGHTEGGQSGQRGGGKRKGVGKHLKPQHNDKVGKPSRQSLPQDVGHKPAPDPAFVGFQRQKEGGNANGETADHTQVQRKHGVGEGCEHGKQRQHQRENILHKEQFF